MDAMRKQRACSARVHEPGGLRLKTAGASVSSLVLQYCARYCCSHCRRGFEDAKTSNGESSVATDVIIAGSAPAYTRTGEASERALMSASVKLLAPGSIRGTR